MSVHPHLIRALIVLAACPLYASATTRVSSHFRLTYPNTVETREAEALLSFLESSRRELLRRAPSSGVRFPDLEVLINETTGDFVGRTGMPPWAAAATRNNRIETQPFMLLKRRGILKTTLRHELAHVLIDTLGGSQTPRWLAEGMAIHIAGEGKLIERYLTAMPFDSLEQSLTAPKSEEEMRAAYATAYTLVQQLILLQGERNVWMIIKSKRGTILETTLHR